MSQRVVPDYNMDAASNSNVPISGLPELQSHLEQLVDDPSVAFDAKLFDDVELQLNGQTLRNLFSCFLF